MEWLSLTGNLEQSPQKGKCLSYFFCCIRLPGSPYTPEPEPYIGPGSAKQTEYLDNSAKMRQCQQ